MPEIIAAEPKAFEAEKLEDIKPRTDLNPGHYLYGKYAAKSVLSGQLDIVAIEDSKGVKALESVSCAAELEAKEIAAKPVEPSEIDSK